MGVSDDIGHSIIGSKLIPCPLHFQDAASAIDRQRSSSLLLDDGGHLLNTAGDKVLPFLIEVLLVVHFQAFQSRLDSELHFKVRLL